MTYGRFSPSVLPQVMEACQDHYVQHAHDWLPFEDRLAFDWAYYHYVDLQSSASAIARGLNMWSATAFKHGSLTGAPWKTAKDMYDTIDTIQTGTLSRFVFHDRTDLGHGSLYPTTLRYLASHPMTPPMMSPCTIALSCGVVLTDS